VRIVLFCHSLRSDWNHGNAHFLRGIAAELLERGHHVDVYEPRNAWSRENLVRSFGEQPLRDFAAAFPSLSSADHVFESLDLDAVLQDADLVLVHEWNEPSLVARIGRHRAAGGRYKLLFHDTHHRASTAPEQMARFDLRHYDGVLAFGEVIRRIYLERGWAARAWTWHEAADTRVFGPAPDSVVKSADLVWVGNWGDGERTRELREFLIEPARRLGLSGSVHGVRYPWRGRWQIRRSGLRYLGWVANYRVPDAFSRHRLTVHIPRRPYVRALPGIPTIRVFEALACGIPLVCAPWEDAEGLFCPGRDYLVAGTDEQMQAAIAAILRDRELARSLRDSGLETILARHTCAHRVDELLDIQAGVRPPQERAA